MLQPARAEERRAIWIQNDDCADFEKRVVAAGRRLDATRATQDWLSDPWRIESERARIEVNRTGCWNNPRILDDCARLRRLYE